jgi:methylphosphotriester-DNA--protein-cysteine methyltransferase
LDKRLTLVLSALILTIAILPVFQSADMLNAKIPTYSVSKAITVDAAYKGKYVASIHSNVYHKATCRYVKKIKRYNKIYFKTKKSAKKHHYRPCKVCRP